MEVLGLCSPMNTVHMPITSKYLHTDRCGSERILSKLNAAIRVVDLIFESKPFY